MFFSGLIQQMVHAFTSLLPTQFASIVTQIFDPIVNLLKSIGL